jgi:hypothetical protein
MPLLFTASLVVVCLGGLLALLPVLISAPAVTTLDAVSHAQRSRQWLVVRSATGSWYLNGDAVSSGMLARSLRQARPGPSAVILMPSSGRRAEGVAADLSWLRRQSAVPVRLDQPEGMLVP